MARNVFFSFHYADVMRVNNVRRSGEFKKAPTEASGINIEGYYDYSLWEKKKNTEGDEAIKTMIRDGVDRTSAICVLIGENTWQRRWVRYEIARSVIEERGLFSIHINSLPHHEKPYQPHPLGEEPCRYIGVARKNNGSFYLCDRKYVEGSYCWKWYRDYTNPVKVPDYMPKPTQGNPLRLSDYTRVYDWSSNGHQNIGAWIDKAAVAAGR